MKSEKLGLKKKHFSLIGKFYDEIPDNLAPHRFKTWEYCYKYFHGNRKKLQSCKKLPNEALLIFSFYLASWGMYRGSSFLLSLDHTIHEKILKELLSKDYNILTMDISELKINNNEDEFVKKLIAARDRIRDVYEPIRTNVLKKQMAFHKKIGKQFNPKATPKSEISNILASKMLLGIFGCIPAYDTFFKQGIKEIFPITEGNGSYPISQKFSEKSVRKIIQCYNDNEELFNGRQYVLKINKNIKYPTMKKIDMLFWLEGYKNSKKIDELD